MWPSNINGQAAMRVKNISRISFIVKISLVGPEDVRMAIHCAWGLEYGSKPKARAVPKTKGTVFSHTDRPIPVNNLVIFLLVSFSRFATNGQSKRSTRLYNWLITLMLSTDICYRRNKRMREKIHMWSYSSVWGHLWIIQMQLPGWIFFQ